MTTSHPREERGQAGEGFVLVPKQATKAMLDAAYAAHDAYEAAETGGWGGLGSAYEAMIAAAPVTGTEGEIERLHAALEWSRSILGNMAMEHTTGWRGIFARWPIHHEPLRGDARAALPIIDAALENRS